MDEILKKVQNNQLSAKKAYKKLYKTKRIRRAKFVKVKIHLYENTWINSLLKVLLIFPIPISIVNRKIKKEISLDFNIRELMFKGNHIDILLNDTVSIKIKGLWGA